MTKENDMKLLKTSLLAATVMGAAALSLGALASDKGHAHSHGDKQAGASAAVTDMTEAEVRKVDKDSKKITLKHGEIKNLDMPGMTMVFQVKDPAMLDKVQMGDKVKFKAEKAAGGYMVTDIQAAK